MTSSSSSQPATNQAISQRKDAILARWLSRVKSELSVAKDLDDVALLDKFPEFLETVAVSITNPSDEKAFDTVRENARAHGSQRARLNFVVSQVISDYVLLRESLIAELNIELTRDHQLALSRIFEASIGIAVEEFTSTQQTQNANENLRTIADAIPTLLIRVDRQFKYVFVNRAYEQWTGRSAANVIGRTVSEIVDPTLSNELTEMMSKSLQGERVAFEHLATRADGASEHMLFTFVPAHDVRGAINGVVITGQSIEQQKLAEIDAMERRHELSNVFAQAPTPIALLMGPEHIFALANPPYIDFVGRNPTGLKAKTVFSMPEFVDRLNEVYETGVPFIGTELPFHDRLINLAYHPYRSTSGEVAGILSFVYDVTEQVRARSAVEASETRLRSVFGHAAVGFAVSDLEGRFLEVNPRFCELTGYSVEELKTMAVIDIVYEGDLEMDRLKLGELTGGSVDSFVIEKRFVRKDGSIVWVRNSVSLVPNPGSEPLIIRVAEDVTAVRESEQRLRLLADSMPQIVWTATTDGLIDYFNQVWYDFADIDPRNTPTDQWNKAAWPEDLPKVIEAWAHSIRTGENFEGRVRLRSKSGEYRWFMTRGRPVRDSNGKITRWYGTNTDVHDQAVLNEQLSQSQKIIEGERHKFTTLVNEATTSIAVLKGQDLVYEIANKSYQNLFPGRPLVGRKLLEALPELEGQAFPKLLAAAYHGEVYREIEAHARLRRTSDGEIEDMYFDQSYTQMQDPNGEPYGVFIQAVNVTERVLARRRLEEVLQRLQVATTAANMGTWDLNPTTGEVSWSARANELFGIEPTSNLPLDIALSRVHPDDLEKLKNAMVRAMDPSQKAPDFSVEYRTRQFNEEYRWIAAVGRATHEPTAGDSWITTRFSGILWDVTDRITAEVAMRDAKERAELANAAKSAFLANMSHEIRTPLGAIMGFVSLMKDEGISQQQINSYVTVVERNSAQLMRIIDDILDLSKVEAGMMVIEHIDFSLVELLSDFASLMGFRAREKGVLFELKAMTELPDVVNSDPTRIRQILTNVVGNAIKFTDRGSVVLRVSYEHEQLRFEVSDTGRGITDDQAEKLFQPFSQGDPSTTRKYGGTGLGLVLTRRLSEALGGGFSLESSKIGVGSTFVSSIRIRLPERSRFVRALGFASESVRNAGVQGLLSDLRVLLVEDSPDNQALFSIYLNRAGAKIDIASDGQRGVEMALAEAYDVVLMDVQMPIMDGITAVKKLRASGYEAPVIALTAHAMKEERIRCLEAGYTGFLSKPIQRSELVDALVKYRAQ